MHRVAVAVLALASLAASSCSERPAPAPPAPPQPVTPAWERANSLRPLPKPPLGIEGSLADLPDPPTPETVRLGRWLFFDGRLSSDGTVSCGTCHRPENAFSEPTPTSTGVGGQVGARKAPSFVNQAWTIFPVFFWDGRAASLEEQAKGPMVNPIEMGNADHAQVVARIGAIAGYRKHFQAAFGSEEVTLDRIAKAIADYERTRMSGNSPWDRWQAGDESAVSDEVKKGHELFHGKAQCNACHLGQNFTDSRFHDLGIGWDAATKAFKDVGRAAVSNDPKDTGAFKTPTLRDVHEHAPYMHDGSLATLEDVVSHYDKGGSANPFLSDRLKPLGLTPEERAALVAFMRALDGEGYADTPPAAFPQ